MDYKIALLIDAENIQVKYLEAIIKEVSNHGRLVISRYYGDIKKMSEEWDKKAINLAIKPMHQYNVASKKNAADMAMALDAMEMLQQGIVNAFFIISSDSDFTPLAIKLKEGGAFVTGIGEESKTSETFKNSCNVFKYFEYLDEEDNRIEIPNNKTEKKELEIEEEIINIIIENSTDNKMMLCRIGDILTNRYSDFDTRMYGFKNLTTLISTIPILRTEIENTTTYVFIENTKEKDEIRKKILSIISKNSSKTMALPKLMDEIKKIHKGFNYRQYGFMKFSKFLNSLKDINVNGNNAKISVKE